MKIIIYANAFHLISGGDVIFAELSKKWIRWGNMVSIVTNEKGEAFCRSRGLPLESIITWKISYVDNFGVYFSSLLKTTLSFFRGFLLNNDHEVIFASSFFWPDLLPALICKIKKPRSKLVVAVYVLFPKPWGKLKYSGGTLKSIVLYFMQSLSLWIVNHYADLVFTASEHDRQFFFHNKRFNKDNVVAIRGGVDTVSAKKVKAVRKKYDVLYFGRFHSQKGLFDLLDIWRLVLEKFPRKKLLLVGGGPLEDKLKDVVIENNLTSSVTFYGIVDGPAKYKILKSAKVFASASQYDTGNIAFDEVLACGIPGVVYNLPHLHYPAGVILVEKGNKRKTAKELIFLLSHRRKRIKLGEEGLEFIKQFDWKKRARVILKLFKK